MKKLKFALLFFFLTFFVNAFAQNEGSSCSDAMYFCTGAIYDFPLQTNNGSAEVGPYYGCLSTTPNPIWYNLKISEAGNIDLYMCSSPDTYDIDFICWGPFSEPTCGSLLSSSNDIDCSYSTSPTETCNIPNAQVGEWYVLLITNYSNQVSNIQILQTGGTGATECQQIEECTIMSLTAEPSQCESTVNRYSVLGTVNFLNQPTSGTLTIEDDNGTFQIFTAPFVSPLNYTLSDLTPDDEVHSVTAIFSNSIYCSESVIYSSPSSCENCVINAGVDTSVCGNSYYFSASVISGDYNTYWTSSNSSVVFNDYTNPLTAVVVSSPGTYTFTWHTTNQTGLACTDEVQITFSQIPTPFFTKSDINCFGDSTILTYTGNASSTAIYNWSLDGGVIQSGAGQGPLVVSWDTAGVHNVTLQVEENGCFGNDISVSILSPAIMLHTKSKVNVQCYGECTGVAMLNVSGGTPPYTYNWASGANILVNLCAGSYPLTVADANGCSITELFIITEPDNISSISHDTICNGEEYIFGSQTITTAGEYTEVFNSLEGCDSTVTLTLNVNPSPIVDLGNDTTLCVGTFITLDAGIADSYLWSGGSTEQTYLVNSDTSAAYYVTVTLGECEETDSVFIAFDPCLSISTKYNTSEIVVYPNPNNGYFILEFNSSISANAIVNLYDLTGKAIMNKTISATITEFDLSTYPKGIYYLQITSNNFVKVEKIVLQ